MRLALLVLLLSGTLLAGSLEIRQPAIEQFEDGPPLLQPDSFTPGETVFFSFLAAGFQRKENQVRLTYRAQPADPLGTPLVASLKGELTETLSPEDKDWVPKLRGSFTLPALLFSGVYKVSFQLRDNVSGGTATGELGFQVSGAGARTADALTVRDLRFYRNEDDEKPLAIATYRAGESIHARFLLVGYKHDGQGGIDVSYGVNLTDSDGRVLFSQPVAARDQSVEFYPKPYVPGSLSFSLKAGTPPGEFSLTIAAKDALGTQSAEAHRVLRLE